MRKVLLTAIFCSALLTAQHSTLPAEQAFEQAVAAQQKGDYSTAVEGYRQILKSKPGFVDARANLAAALVHLSQFEEAIRNYEIAIREAPQASTLRMNLGLAYYKKGDVRLAEQQFARARQAEPDNLKVAILDADCLSKMGEDGRAVALLKPFRASHPEDLDLAYVLGAAMVRSGQPDQGIALLEQVGKEGQSADAYFLAASAALARNEGAQSLDQRVVDDLKAAQRLNPDLPGLLTKLGVAEEGAGNADEAERLFRQVLQQNPDDFDANVHLGGVLYSKRNLDEARKFVAHALSLQPDSSFALYETALLESADGKTDEAVSHLEKVVQKSPDWLQPHVQLSALYYKLHRAEDGLRERRIVARLTEQR
jgi:tetratricopeptide (TPR) repeat protein